MAEGVLPFVRGLDLTQNNFKVSLYFYALLQEDDHFAIDVTKLFFLGQPGIMLPKESRRHAKPSMAQIEQHRTGDPSR